MLSGHLGLPPGKIVLKTPGDLLMQPVTMNGRPVVTFAVDPVVIGEFPAKVTVNYHPVLCCRPLDFDF